jgi:hypothetical protein
VNRSVTWADWDEELLALELQEIQDADFDVSLTGFDPGEIDDLLAMGSGTTLAAAELTERICYGIELDPKYVDVVIQRWQSLSGQKATLDGDGRTFDELAQERRKEAA